MASVLSCFLPTRVLEFGIHGCAGLLGRRSLIMLFYLVMMGGWAGPKGPADYVFGGIDRRMTGGPSGHEGFNRDARKRVSAYRLVRVFYLSSIRRSARVCMDTYGRKTTKTITF